MHAVCNVIILKFKNWRPQHTGFSQQQPPAAQLSDPHILLKLQPMMNDFMTY